MLFASILGALLPVLTYAQAIDTPSQQQQAASPPVPQQQVPPPTSTPPPIVIEGYGTTLSSYIVQRNTQCKNCPYSSCLNSGYMSTGSNLTFDCWLHGEAMPLPSSSASSSSSSSGSTPAETTTTWLKFTYGTTLDEYCFVPASDLQPSPYYQPGTLTAQQTQIPYCGSRLEADLYLPSIATTTTAYTECSLCPYRDCPGVDFFQAHTLLQVDCMTREGWQQFAPDFPNGTAVYYRVAVGGAPGGVSAGLGPVVMGDGTAPTTPGSLVTNTQQQSKQPCYVSLASVQELQGKPYILAIGGGGEVTEVSIQDPLPPCGPVPVLAFVDGEEDGAGRSGNAVVSDQGAAGEFTAAAVGADLNSPEAAVSSVLPPASYAGAGVGMGAGAGVGGVPFTHFANAPSLFPAD